MEFVLIPEALPIPDIAQFKSIVEPREQILSKLKLYIAFFQVVQSLRLQSSSKSYSELGSCPTLSGNNRPLLARTIPSKVRQSDTFYSIINASQMS